MNTEQIDQNISNSISDDQGLPGYGIPQTQIHTSDDQSLWTCFHCYESNNTNRQNEYYLENH